MTHSINRRQALIGAGAAAACALLRTKTGLRAAESQNKYPHVNTAVRYEVDPYWPRRPKNATWEAVPGVAVDERQRVWLFTRSAIPIQVYDAGGKYLRGWGGDLCKTPHGLSLDHQGNVWVTDCGEHVVMQFTPEGKLTKTLGTRGVAGDDRDHFDQPTDVAVAPDGEIFVADGYGNSRIVHFDREGEFVKQWGKPGVEPGEFSIPHAIVRDPRGRLYVADRNNVRIQVFDESGRLLDVWNNLLVPWGLCVGNDDDIWACGSSPMKWLPDQECLGCPPKDQLVMRFSPSGKLLALWTFPKGEDGEERPGELNWIHDVALDREGNLYVGDIIGRRLQKFIRRGPASEKG